MRSPWSLADILDSEFFFSRDETLVDEGQSQAIEQRDRDIYLALHSAADAPPATADLVQHWLAHRRSAFVQQQQAVLPGQVWRETNTLARWSAFFLSLLSGSLATAVFLRYTGVAPVNVSGYFAFFILLQLLLLLFHLGLLGYRGLRRNDLRASLLLNLLARLLRKLFLALYRRSARGAGGKQRLDLAATFGSLKISRQLYGSLFLWPVFVLLQLGGVGFNLGVLATTLAKVSFSDIAFGWQSTLPLPETLLAELVRWIAMPWSWLVPEQLAYPTLEQISGSKIILKEGIYHLTTPDLTAWWPFLCFGVLTYGLLPRLLLLLYGSTRQATKLRRFSYTSANFRQLRRRMLKPVIETAASHRIPPVSPPPASTTPVRGSHPQLAPGPDSRGWLLLIPDELWDDCPVPLLAPHVQSAATEPLVPLRYGAVNQGREALFDELARKFRERNLAGILLLQEAWQPPIREIIDFLRQLRRHGTPTLPLAVALIGKPHADRLLTPVRDGDLQIWLKTTKTLADPYLEVFALVKH